MCVDAAAGAYRWADADDALLAARHRLPLLITAPTDGAVVEAAREIHVASFIGPAPMVTFRASGFLWQPAQFAAQWRALSEAAREGSVLITAIDEMSCAAQLLLLGVLTPDHAPRTARLMTGTTVSLLDRVTTGEFLEELYYRLNMIHLEVRLHCQDAHDRDVATCR